MGPSPGARYDVIAQELEGLLRSTGRQWSKGRTGFVSPAAGFLSGLGKSSMGTKEA